MGSKASDDFSWRPQHGAWEVFVRINERMKDETEGQTPHAKHCRVKVMTGLNSLNKRGRGCNKKPESL